MTEEGMGAATLFDIDGDESDAAELFTNRKPCNSPRDAATAGRMPFEALLVGEAEDAGGGGPAEGSDLAPSAERWRAFLAMLDQTQGGTPQLCGARGRGNRPAAPSR
jgi:hypothetical protein